MAKIIQVRNLTKTYGSKNKVDVLKSINLDIEEGSFNWIVGSSGSGKTTLLNLISGIDEASKGDIYIGGKKINGLSEKEKAKFRAESLGFVFQFHYLLPEFNALENVLLPLRIQKKRINKKVKAEAVELLKSIGLGHVYKQFPNELSGGEAQRTAIARAIIGKPKLVIADEPTGNLDSTNASAIYELIRKLHKDLKTTFIIVTHDEFDLEKGDRLIKLQDGIIIEDIISKGWRKF